MIYLKITEWAGFVTTVVPLIYNNVSSAVLEGDSHKMPQLPDHFSPTSG